MRVAALYDIHGNLPALEAVLRDVRGAAVDEIVIGGDVLPGPMPRETIACLLNLDPPVRFLRGNGDREVLARRRGMETGAIPESFREAMRWVAEQLHPDDDELLAGWPATLSVTVPGLGKVLFCHASPRNDVEVFTRLTPEKKLLPVLEGVDASVVVCGHTHMQFDRTVGGTRVVNAGSVGMPYGDPGAYWLLLGPDVQHRRTLYDFDEAAGRVRRTGYPDASNFAAESILRPRSEADILDLFTRFELK